MNAEGMRSGSLQHNCAIKCRSISKEMRENDRATTGQSLLVNSGAKTNQEYREYMTRNACSVISLNQNAAVDAVSTFQGSAVIGHRRDSPPYLYQSPASTAQPMGYQNSDLKKDYLAKYRAASAMTHLRVDTQTMHSLKGMFAGA